MEGRDLVAVLYSYRSCVKALPQVLSLHPVPSIRNFIHRQIFCSSSCFTVLEHLFVYFRLYHSRLVIEKLQL